MGRIRSSRKDDLLHDGECHIEVVGRHRDTGVLVFGFAPAPRKLEPTQWLHWLAHARYSGLDKQLPCKEFRSASGTYDKDSYTILDQGGYKLVWDYKIHGQHCYSCDSLENPHDRYDPRYEEWIVAAQRGDFCDMPALEAIWREKAADQHAYLVRALKLRAEAEALPLIVLAGLK